MKRRFSLSLLSRHRSALYGFAALWILFFHMDLPGLSALKPLNAIRQSGCCGVDMFAMLSAIGLYRSLERSPRLGAFYLRRFARVLPPSLIAAALTYGLSGASAKAFLAAVAFFPYWLGADTLWYVPFILTMYLLYPALYRLQKRTPHALAALFAISIAAAFAAPVAAPGWAAHCALAVTRIPAFLLGCIAAPLVAERRSIPAAAPALALIPYASATWLYGRMDARFQPATLALSFLFLSIFLLVALSVLAELLSHARFGRCINRTFAFFGSISLETYLIYSRLSAALAKCLPLSPAPRAIVCLALTTLLALLLRKTADAATHAVHALENKRKEKTS